MNIEIRMRDENSKKANNFAEDMLRGLADTYPSLSSAHLDVETHTDGTDCKLVLMAGHWNQSVSSREDNLYEALQSAVDKAESAIKREMDQIKEIKGARTLDDKFLTQKAFSQPKEIVLPHSVNKVDAEDVLKFEASRAW